MNEGASKLYRWIRRYVSLVLVLVVAYVVYVLFLNEYSVMRKYELDQSINSLRAEIKVSQDTCDYYLRLNQSLKTDPATMERVMRERYNYQKPGEDVYIFE